MFYSHHLLARKAPLGQIWLAATKGEKINRRKLNKIDIIKICEEISNPQVPLALRVSGILMGGVVIVYESKVKLLYDDANRLLGEINQAWKVKDAPSNPTRLSKGKSHAKYETVTLPPNRNEDLSCSDTANTRLDNMDVPCLNQKLQGDQEQDHHQADAANITLNDNYDSCQADTTTFNHFERFEDEGFPDIIPSPPCQEALPKSNEVPAKQRSASKEANLKQKRQRVARKRPAALLMDYGQITISNADYKPWLEDSSDIIRGERGKDALSMMKIGTAMELPSVVLIGNLFTDGDRQVYYPAPLLEEWRRSIQPHPHSSPPLAPITPVAQSRPGVVPGSPEHVRSTAVRGMQKASGVSKEMTHEILPEEIRSNLKNNRFGAVGASSSASKVNQRPITRSITRSQQSNLMATPANSGDELRSIPSSESESEHVSGRSSKKRPFVPSTSSGDGLEHKVDEGVHGSILIRTLS